MTISGNQTHYNQFACPLQPREVEYLGLYSGPSSSFMGMPPDSFGAWKNNIITALIKILTHYYSSFNLQL